MYSARVSEVCDESRDLPTSYGQLLRLGGNDGNGKGNCSVGWKRVISCCDFDTHLDYHSKSTRTSRCKLKEREVRWKSTSLGCQDVNVEGAVGKSLYRTFPFHTPTCEGGDVVGAAHLNENRMESFQQNISTPVVLHLNHLSYTPVAYSP